MTGPRTAVTTPCPRCGAPTIRTPQGTLLAPEPHPLAINLPDGRRLTAVQAVRIALGHAEPAGHHPHRPGQYGCNPQPPLTLF